MFVQKYSIPFNTVYQVLFLFQLNMGAHFQHFVLINDQILKSVNLNTSESRHRTIIMYSMKNGWKK